MSWAVTTLAARVCSAAESSEAVPVRCRRNIHTGPCAGLRHTSRLYRRADMSWRRGLQESVSRQSRLGVAVSGMAAAFMARTPQRVPIDGAAVETPYTYALRCAAVHLPRFAVA
jgi:hypothetical protein